jgi:hypothetical protein
LQRLLERRRIRGVGAGHGEVHDRRRQFDAAHAEPVDHRRRAAAGGGDDEDFSWSLEIQRIASRQQRGNFQQRLQHVDAHDAAILKIRVERGVAAGQRAGVRAGRRFAERRAAELVGHHGFSGLVS